MDKENKLSGVNLASNKFCSTILHIINPLCSSVCTLNDQWIVNSAAIDHITNSFSNLVKPTPVTSFIHLPNGKVSSITCTGTINLTLTLTLFNVLYVPDFQYSLIFVSKLTSNNACCVLFSPHQCVFQDPMLRTLKGTGSLDGGLYSFQDSNSAVN